jgi:hypothetical protein
MTSVPLRRLLSLAIAMASAGALAQQPAPAPAAQPQAQGNSACLTSIKAKPKDGEERDEAKSNAKMDGVKGACRLEDGKQFTAARTTEEGRKLEQWEHEENDQELRKFNEGHEGPRPLKLVKAVETIDVTESETRRKVAEVPWAPYSVDEFGFIEKANNEFGGIDGQFGMGGRVGGAAAQGKGVSDAAEAKKSASAMAAVPEPGSYALMLGGLALISLIFRRRADKAQPAARQ